MASEPNLRPVPSPDDDEPTARTRPSARSRTRRPSGAEILLGIALVIALALLIWSRTQLGGRIDALEAETQALRTAVAERERVISAQRGRLGEVRDHVERLGALLDQPLPD